LFVETKNIIPKEAAIAIEKYGIAFFIRDFVRFWFSFESFISLHNGSSECDNTSEVPYVEAIVDAPPLAIAAK
jgi:hypothetical protein